MRVMNAQGLVRDGLEVLGRVFTALGGEVSEVIDFFSKLLSGEIIIVNDPFLHVVRDFIRRASRAKPTIDLTSADLGSEVLEKAVINAWLGVVDELMNFIKGHSSDCIDYIGVSQRINAAREASDLAAIMGVTRELLNCARRLFLAALSELSDRDVGAAVLLASSIDDLISGEVGDALIKYLLALATAKGNKALIRLIMETTGENRKQGIS